MLCDLIHLRFTDIDYIWNIASATCWADDRRYQVTFIDYDNLSASIACQIDIFNPHEKKLESALRYGLEQLHPWIKKKRHCFSNHRKFHRSHLELNVLERSHSSTYTSRTHIRSSLPGRLCEKNEDYSGCYTGTENRFVVRRAS